MNNAVYVEKRWEETIETLFKILVTPVSIVFAVTWSFLFFYGSSIPNPLYVVEGAEPQLAQDIMILFASVFFWILENFLAGTKANLSKFASFNLLTFLLLISPRSIFVSSLNMDLHDINLSLNLYYLIASIIQIFILVVSLPPSIHERIKGALSST
jgi:hypothetical protein